MARFEFTVVDEKLDIRMPHLPMTISFGNRSVDISDVLDTGAEISILPYSVGCKLGAKWEEQPKSFPITQGFGGYETRLVKARATHPQLTNDNIPVQLLFAWAKSDSIQLLFGQIDFLKRFNVCFYRSQNFFECGAASHAGHDFEMMRTRSIDFGASLQAAQAWIENTDP